MHSYVQNLDLYCNMYFANWIQLFNLNETALPTWILIVFDSQLQSIFLTWKFYQNVSRKRVKTSINVVTSQLKKCVLNDSFLKSSLFLCQNSSLNWYFKKKALYIQDLISMSFFLHVNIDNTSRTCEKKTTTPVNIK